MKEKEYTTEDFVAIHQEFFTLAREVEDLRLHGELLSAFIKSFQICYDLGFQDGMNFDFELVEEEYNGMKCPVCGSNKTYETRAIHCNHCAVTTEI